MNFNWVLEVTSLSLLQTALGSKGVTWLLWAPKPPCYVMHLGNDDALFAATFYFISHIESKSYGTCLEGERNEGPPLRPWSPVRFRVETVFMAHPVAQAPLFYEDQQFAWICAGGGEQSQSQTKVCCS